VVLVGGARASGGGGGEPLVDRAHRRLEIKLHADLPGGVALDLEPAAYRALKEREKEMEASELRRLLYVATTRARDRLVLTCFGKLTTAKGERPPVMLAPVRGALRCGSRCHAGPSRPRGCARAAASRAHIARRARDALDPKKPSRASVARGCARGCSTAARPALATSPSALEADRRRSPYGRSRAPAIVRALALVRGASCHGTLRPDRHVVPAGHRGGGRRRARTARAWQADGRAGRRLGRRRRSAQPPTSATAKCP
jgi:hypothetical protein